MHRVGVRAAGNGAGHAAGDGPAVDTPLSRFFYRSWRNSGLTLDAIARRAGVSVATVGHYVQGQRGAGGQRRTSRTVVALAEAMGADPDEAVRLAGIPAESGVIKAIRDDRLLPRHVKDAMIALAQAYQPPR